MSENDLPAAPVCEAPAPMTDQGSEQKRPRGRIPRAAWGYVLGLYDKGRETLKSIGDRFGVEPSAVHYVLKQARLQNLEATLDPPSNLSLVTSRTHDRRTPVTPSPAARPARLLSLVSSSSSAPSPAAAPAPVVDEAVEQVSKSPLARRVFDASALVINAILAFEREPTRENNQKLDEARKAGSRALAAVEIWTHQMTALQPAARPASAPPVPVQMISAESSSDGSLSAPAGDEASGAMSPSTFGAPVKELEAATSP